MSLHCTWRDVMREAAQRLSAGGVENAPREARLLLAHALGVDPVEVIGRDMDAVDGAALTVFEDAVTRRLSGEPVSRIRGWKEFYGRRFEVSDAVLDPRPETELLVEFATKHLPPGGRLLDLGTGSGAIICSVLAERPDVQGVGVDLSPAALAMASRNAERLGVGERAVFVAGGWDAAPGPFDIVVSNPPYIPSSEIAGLDREVREHDPLLALDGGPDGLAPYRAIAGLAGALLVPGGRLAVEIGAGQADAVSTLFVGAGLTLIARTADLAGHLRMISAQTGETG
ncbi:MAG: peptide chain release factor N(5)-glutamine methyltransferase [Hyphomonadaceae bacterium]